MTLSRKVIVVALSITIICLLATVHATPKMSLWLDNIHWLTTNAACLIFGRVWDIFAPMRPIASCKGWFVIGTLFYFMGGVIWIFEVLSQQTHFPAQSDIFYPLMGPCFIVGFIIALRTQLSRSKSWAFTVDTMAFSVAVIGYVLIFIFT